jgi:dolichol-phosphate mannosyltransferase
MISIIVPTYNEKDNIKPLIERLHETLKKYRYEVIIVDDNSSDGTVEIATGLSKKYPLKVLVRKDEKGLATAVLHGFKFAQGDIIGVMDADLQHPPEINSKLIGAIENGADMAIASRYIDGGGCPNWGLLRKIISRGASIISHLFLPSVRKIKDPMSGFFMFKKNCIEGIKFKPIGYKILLEMLVMGKFNKVAEIPFTFEDRGSGASKMKATQQIDYLKHVFSLMIHSGELARVFKFISVGLSGVIVNEGILWFLTECIKFPYYASSVFGIEASIISNFIFNDRFTFKDMRNKSTTFFNRLLKFNFTCGVGALIQYGLLILFTEVFGVNYLISNLIGIMVAFIWNYTLSLGWTWKSKN